MRFKRRFIELLNVAQFKAVGNKTSKQQRQEVSDSDLLNQVHQGVIQDCGAQTSISFFIQMSMCVANVTCCLDALCYYFIAHEVRSSKNTLKRSVFGQRRTTCSSSEV